MLGKLTKQGAFRLSHPEWTGIVVVFDSINQLGNASDITLDGRYIGSNISVKGYSDDPDDVVGIVICDNS